MVSVTCNYDMGRLTRLSANLWPERVGEAWCHVWYSQAELVFESSCDGASCELASHPVRREVVSPDSVFSVRLLVIVHHELLNTVIVQINISN